MGIDFPASREELIEHVTRRGGPPQVLDTLQALPRRTFAEESDLAGELQDAR